MEKTSNVHIEGHFTLPSPAEIQEKYPLTPAAAQVTVATRRSLEAILDHTCRRQIVITGPCSIHNESSALEYARRLKVLSDKVSDRMLCIMRVYFEKPRTTVGWKGLIYDPDIDESCDIEKGLNIARNLIITIAEMGVPSATEFLDPVIPQYIADVISWAAIGARTTESQTHRQLASGLSMPTGFKNATDGNIRVAVDAINSAKSRHTFLGVTDSGRSGFFRTSGNPYTHVVLRGGASGPNYGSEHIAFAAELMRKSSIIPNIIIDCSHDNSGKQPKRQITAMKEGLAQIRGGETSIVGFMLESHLKGGKQEISSKEKMQPDMSITDACLSWEETESLILEAYDLLGK